MKRSPPKSQGFARSERIEAREVTNLKMPKAEPKQRTRKCAVAACRQPFQPRNISHKCCGPECALAYAEQLRAKADRIARRQGLEKLKRRADWLAEAQRAFNAFIRERDKDQPCICCDRTSEKQYLTGTNWHAGHYRSVGSAPHMRFIENNVHKQLAYCNDYGSGRAVDYRIGLIARIGLEAVEALESDQTPRKYTIDDLKAIKAHYVAKLKELKGKQCQE